jgi:WhiB family redox-sensing transcriptional regulator
VSLASTDWSDADWRTQAACRNIEPDLFFPLGRTREALVHIEEAKAVCRGCPVHAECLEFALANNLEDGVWGGTSEDERRRLRPAWLAGRRRPKVAHG